MGWVGLVGGVLGLACGIALVFYSRRFPRKRNFLGRTGIPVPPAPYDQRSVIMGSGIFLSLIAVVVLFTTLIVSSALARG